MVRANASFIKETQYFKVNTAAQGGEKTVFYPHVRQKSSARSREKSLCVMLSTSLGLWSI